MGVPFLKLWLNQRLKKWWSRLCIFQIWNSTSFCFVLLGALVSSRVILFLRWSFEELALHCFLFFYYYYYLFELTNKRTHPSAWAGPGTGTERTGPWVWQTPSSIISVWSPRWRGAIVCSRQTPRNSRWRFRAQRRARLFSLLPFFSPCIFLNVIKSLPPARSFVVQWQYVVFWADLGKPFCVCIYIYFFSLQSTSCCSVFFCFCFFFLSFLLFLGGVPETLSQGRLKSNLKRCHLLPQESCKFEPKIPETVFEHTNHKLAMFLFPKRVSLTVLWKTAFFLVYGRILLVFVHIRQIKLF